MPYAEETKVPVAKTQHEIQDLLTERYHASAYQLTVDIERNLAGVEFILRNRRIRIILQLPSPDADQYHRTPKGYRRTDKAAALNAYNQDVRSRWRGLLLVIKAKMDAIERGVVTFDDEWMAHLVLPTGYTVSETITPQLPELMAGTAELPALLPGKH